MDSENMRSIDVSGGLPFAERVDIRLFLNVYAISIYFYLYILHNIQLLDTLKPQHSIQFGVVRVSRRRLSASGSSSKQQKQKTGWNIFANICAQNHGWSKQHITHQFFKQDSFLHREGETAWPRLKQFFYTFSVIGWAGVFVKPRFTINIYELYTHHKERQIIKKGIDRQTENREIDRER